MNITREIKFRIWDKDNNKMLHYDNDIVPCLTLNGVLQDCSKEVSSNVSYKYEIMQFTGLLDKNGKEIYESDIIQTDVNLKKWIVYEEDYAWYVKNIGSNEKYPLGVYKKLISVASSKLEVIGNIYQNKNLIN
jgi:uncharacterized phage protein (TIGR01671 family)